MPPSSPATMPSRRQSSAKAARDEDDDGGLTQSLRDLSLTSQPAKSPRLPTASSPRLPTASSPLQPPPPPGRRSSLTTSARPRLPSRSPSNGRESRASRAGTPPLIRKASMNSLHSGNGALTASRRSSSAQLLSPTTKAAFALQEEERPWVTANSIARDHFQAELDAHHGPASTLPADTVVVLNDAVYGHRYSRPRTSRNALSTIVERPERIKASMLGVAAAYVRLGGRHDQGARPIRPAADAAPPPSIPFRIRKTDRRLPLASPAVTNVHGAKWMDELRLMCDAAESKLAMGGKELQRPDTHRSAADGPPPEKLHEGDLYLCAESLEAIEGALGAVCDAVDAVFASQHRRAFVGVRPPGHHCSASHPSGFCWVNNVHVGIMHAVLAHGLTHAAIIDFDLHHGDGSQAIAWQHNTRASTASKNAAAWKKTPIGYFSLHDINSYPCEMGDEEKVKNASLCIDNAHGQTIWNVHLEPWKDEQDFWSLYESKYAVLLDKTRRFLRQQAERLRACNQAPRAAIFLSAGFDASEWEGLGMQRHQVNVPTGFYARIGRDVVALAAEVGLDVDGRVISVLEGGYSDRALASGILSHLSGLAGREGKGAAAASTTAQRNGHRQPPDAGAEREELEYDASWWAAAELDKLEKPPSPPSPPRKPRNLTPPTYTSPTQASTAKVVDPERMKRSLSGLVTGRPIMERVPTPPPPDVHWVVAAHELSRLIIPSGRQTDSCKPEDLNAEATRARRDRQSLLLGMPPPPPPPPPPAADAPASRPTSRMALRERKTRAIVPIDEETAEPPQPKTRRKTVGVAAASPEKPLPSRMNTSSTDEPSSRRIQRRLSGTSTGVAPTKKQPSQPETDEAPMRPASAMSSRAPTNGKLAVRKTRTAAGARKEAAARAPKKPSSPPRKGPAPSPDAQAPRPSTAPGTQTTGDGAEAMESITTGMKKIKINLITQSQREAKERARLEADSGTVSPVDKRDDPHSAAASARSQALPRPEAEGEVSASTDVEAAEPAAPAPQALPRPKTPPPAEAQTAAAEERRPSSAATPDPRQSALPPSSPDVLHGPGQAGDEMFVAYQPEGPVPVAVSQQEPLKWLPPNVPTPSANTPVATPSPAKKKDGLFHYKSGIPFAPRPASPSAESAKADSIWEIPETPEK
ncbi:hypothetical protein CDD83_3023 [Cordyceps sp. RAO-2017]|nr:hypothetical protein CDD83_3023 [Cordyceps sp. RAO-2017]